jgi:Ni/Co efflux regulator RcnB
MDMKKILTTAMAACVMASAAGAALAQPGRHDRPPPSFERRADHRYHAPRYVAPRGYKARAWHRGDRLPAAYRGRGYYVDYRTYHLAPPPRGYQYVRVGNDVVLTAIATGVVASVISQLFD